MAARGEYFHQRNEPINQKMLSNGQTRSEIFLIRICCGRQNVCLREVWSIMLRNHFRNTENTLRGLFLFPNRWRDRIFQRIICLFTSFSPGRAESRSRRSSSNLCFSLIKKYGLSLVWQSLFCCTMHWCKTGGSLLIDRTLCMFIADRRDEIILIELF